MCSVSIVLIFKEQSVFPQLLLVLWFFTLGKKDKRTQLICITKKKKCWRVDGKFCFCFRDQTWYPCMLLFDSLIREKLLKKKGEKITQKSPTPLRIAELNSCSLLPLVTCEVVRKLKRDFDCSHIIQSCHAILWIKHI